MILVTAGRGARATTKYVYLRCLSVMSVPRASESVRCAREYALCGFHSRTIWPSGLCCLVHAVIDAIGVRHVIAEALCAAATRYLQ